MLQSLRKGASTWVVRAFLAILIVSFGIGIWQGNSLFKTGADTAVAKVGDAEVTAQDFQIAFDRELRQLQQQLGGTFTREQAIAFNIQGAVLSQLVSDATIREAADRFDIRVPDDLIAREIAAIPAFQGITGKFDATRFQLVLRQANLSEAMLTGQIRAELLRAQLYGPAASGARVPQIAAAALYRFRNERRTIDYFAVTPAAVGTIAAPDEAAIDAYYKANPQSFTAPEYRAVTILALDPAEIARTITPTEEAIAGTYEEHRAEYVTEEKRDVDQIVVTTREDADKALAELAAGKPFAEVAKAIAKMDEADTKLGLVTKGTLPTALADAVFAAAEGGFGGPVQSPLGWHLFKVNKIEAGITRPLEAVRDEIAAIAAREEANLRLTDLGKALQDELASGATLEEVGERLKVPVKKVEAIDAKGFDRDGKAIALADSPQLLPGLFEAEAGRDGEILDTANGGYVIGRVDAVTPSALKPLDQVKAEVAKAWEVAERKTRQQRLADELVGALNDGKPVAEVAKQVAAVPGMAGPGQRSGDTIFSALPAEIVTRLFTLDKGKAAAAPALNGEDIVVGAVRDIEVAEPGDNAAGVKALADTLRNDFAGDLAAVLESDLRQRFGVSVNETLINSLLGGPAR
ncbi:peptidylprolyl isomerase [Zavarzinia compransoris]|nr:peptidylprolyl isomerase [Zavarzinia compransoris]TDP48050.1 peptidyl-prolyl cis-trans isomerase D [Zavarzinia compransoris]